MYGMLNKTGDLSHLLQKKKTYRVRDQLQYMDKRIPRNAKYQHVKTRLDTGCSLTKYMERLEEIKRNYRYRADEIFKRLKVTTFAQLILQVASVSELNDDVDSHGPEDGLSVSDSDLEFLSQDDNSTPHASPLSDCQDVRDARETCYSARSTLLSVVSGVGERGLDRKSQKMESEVSSFKLADRSYPDCPYLLLDVRDRDQYDCCHIISAHSFPITKLSRTMNPYTKEVLEYKNAAGKIIIVYDEDERIASQAATIMCERGVENLFMLSGGLKVISQKFPEGMTTGSLPTSCLSCPASSKGKKSSVQHQQEPQAAEKRWRFTSDELVKIQEQLDEMLIPSNPNSRMSSRMSTLSSQSNASSAGSRLSSSTAGRNSARVQSSRPWK
ncbi:centrosomal protein of 41 kDa-like isoform X2 [Scophthalmus maximus]|uniref:centrosomal protein of 41 kDa-like isoform X2 n=1 Tax=Scophthalmus maximus TaxID=52904 RepID=UPI001FA890A9|nr:centrosomal protein of 41 kDa-like isoform X2 [Scophthalmus maximus]